MEPTSMPARPWWKDIELVLPLVLLLATTIYLAASFRISTAFDSGIVNSAFTPRVVALLMYAALLFVLRDALRARPTRGQDAGEAAAGSWAEPVWVVVLTAVYVVAFRPLGYVISTLLYVYALFWLFLFDEKSQLKRILYCLVITAIFYGLFTEVFHVRLPRAGGIL